jgi:hypothetical protein
LNSIKTTNYTALFAVCDVISWKWAKVVLRLNFGSGAEKRLVLCLLLLTLLHNSWMQVIVATLW